MKFDVSFNNCYGIETLKYEFCFNDKPIIVHAPNGTFKTSFCKTIHDIINGLTPQDQVSKTSGTASILINGRAASSNQIILYYNVNTSKYDGIIEKSKALLLNQNLRNELEAVEQPYKQQLDSLVTEIKKDSGFKDDANLRNHLLKTFDVATIDELIKYLHRHLKRFKAIPFTLENYSHYFTSDIEKILQSQKTKTLIKKYESLCKKASKRISFIQNDIFDVQDFLYIANTLEEKNYFMPGNSIKLVGKKTIKNNDDLKKIKNEINKILSSDPTISSNFQILQDSIKNKRGGSKLSNNIKGNHLIAGYYCDYSGFEKKYFLSLFKKYYNDVCNAYALKANYDKKLKAIRKKASKDVTIWGKTVDVFNTRFDNKYSLEIVNKPDAVLGISDVSLLFKYKDNSIDYVVQLEDLYDKILSEGEKRAFLLLDIIFDIEKFKIEGKQKLLIFDDIADALDYTNKHCIIEYLKEIAENSLFDVLLLTHNFDFYRHFGKKVGLSHNNALFAGNDGKGNITIENGGYLNNLFLYLKVQAEKPNSLNSALALIPFARTNVENRHKSQNEYLLDKNYLKYTKMLHYRPNGGPNITGNSLYKLFSEDISIKADSLRNNSSRIYKIIYNQALAISSSTQINQKIEEKIVMSIALRIYGEKYMFKRLKSKRSSISPNFDFDKAEFGNTLGEFRKIFEEREKEIKILDSISILTPMEIHVNGFAYEPLIDYSITRLRTLFKELISFAPESILYK